MAGIVTCETPDDGLSNEGSLRYVQLSMDKRVQKSDRTSINKIRSVLPKFGLFKAVFYAKWQKTSPRRRLSGGKRREEEEKKFSKTWRRSSKTHVCMLFLQI